VGNAEGALAGIDQALALAAETGAHIFDPFLHRLRGDILLKRDPTSSAPAEDAYRKAITIADQQGARSYVLLPSLSLAKLFQSTGRLLEARAALARAPALYGFAPTPEMSEIVEAEALLAALAETDEVKADATALLQGRGMHAPETRAAFARAGDIAAAADPMESSQSSTANGRGSSPPGTCKGCWRWRLRWNRSPRGGSRVVKARSLCDVSSACRSFSRAT
jgi:hypothetical protein